MTSPASPLVCSCCPRTSSPRLKVVCGILKRYGANHAEIACLAVRPEYRGGKRGDAMLTYLERVALAQGIRTVIEQKSNENENNEKGKTRTPLHPFMRLYMHTYAHATHKLNAALPLPQLPVFQCTFALRQVFVLSTRTLEFFAERGFLESSPDFLPPERPYNRARGSKVLTSF